MAEESKVANANAPGSLETDELEFRFFESEEDLQTIISMIE